MLFIENFREITYHFLRFRALFVIILRDMVFENVNEVRYTKLL